MAPPRCSRCPLPAALRRPRTAAPLCRPCFLRAFEAEAARAIIGDVIEGGTHTGTTPPSPLSPHPGGAPLTFYPPPAAPKPGSSIAVAASGGKDSTVLAHLLSQLNQRRGWGYRLVLVAVDEGIEGYREEALGAVRRGRGDLPLLVLSHRELFGWSVDQLGAKLGKGGSRCTFCGVWRRQALERGARLLGVDWLATGHNADDIAETVLMNFLRGDVARLRRAATEATGVATQPTEVATEATGATTAPGEATEATTSPGKGSKRSVATKKSKGATKSTVVATDNITEATKTTMVATKNPIEASKSPMETTETINTTMVATKNPMETTKSPMETTMEVPVASVATKDPMVATKNSMETTETTKDPMEATRDPMVATRTTMEPTKDTVEATKNLTETTKTSMVPTKTFMGTIEATPNPLVATTTSVTVPAPSPTAAKNPPATTSFPVATSPLGSHRQVPEPPVAAPWPPVPRCKPLRHAYEKEIVLYAHFKGLDYFSTECGYSPQAYRGHARNLLKDLEATRASTVAALGHSGRRLAVGAEVATKKLGGCRRCGFATSQGLCKACVLLASLEKGLPRLGLGKRAVEMASQLEGFWGGGHEVGGHEVGGHRDGGHGVGGHGACCHGVGGHQDGGHGVCCHGVGGHQGGGHGASGHGACCHGVGGHQDGSHGVGGHGACCHGVGGHGAGGNGVSSHGANCHQDGGHHDGGHGACCHGDGGRGVGGRWACCRGDGGPGVGSPVASGGWGGGGAEVEVVGGAGGEGRRRVVGVGRVRGALNIWDF